MRLAIEMLQCNSPFCLFPARRVGAHMLDLDVLEEIKGREDGYEAAQ